MSLTKSTVLVLLISSLVFAQIDTEGGNVSELDLTHYFQSARWAGFFGDVTLGGGLSYLVPANGNNITLLDVIAQQPPCDYSSINMHIIAINDTNLTPSLIPGNLSILDSLTGNSSENGSNTFTLTESFTLSSGTYPGVPTTYTYADNASSASFRQGYFNDGAGNLIFVADIVTDMPDWNGSLSDYQIMLPTNGSEKNYTIWGDVAYSCISPPDDEGGDTHRLVIEPIYDFEVTVGESFYVEVVVRNTGDFNEWNVELSLACPSGLTCESTTIPNIPAGGEETILLLITAYEEGDFGVTARARNDRARAEMDFNVVVLEGPIIPPPFEKKPVNETCNENYECMSDICTGGICVECRGNEDCGSNQFCNAYWMCQGCPCGYMADGKCIPYECCSDEGCTDSEFCIEHACTYKELEILTFDEIIIEGEDLLLKIINNKGEEVGLADVFTEEMSVYADQNGYATIPAPYDGLIYSYKNGYPQIGKIVPVIKKGFFEIGDEIVTGTATVICIFDSKGLPVVGATVEIGGESITTDANGCFEHTFHTPGQIPLKANKDGYLIDEKDLSVGLPVCRFPVVFGIWGFPPASIHLLWILSIIGSLINFRTGNGKFEWVKKKAAIYAFLPLVLALPNVWIFSICFMSNVVLIQLIAEILILIRRALRCKVDEEKNIYNLEKRRKRK